MRTFHIKSGLQHLLKDSEGLAALASLCTRRAACKWVPTALGRLKVSLGCCLQPPHTACHTCSLTSLAPVSIRVCHFCAMVFSRPYVVRDILGVPCVTLLAHLHSSWVGNWEFTREEAKVTFIAAPKVYLWLMSTLCPILSPQQTPPAVWMAPRHPVVFLGLIQIFRVGTPCLGPVMASSSTAKPSSCLQIVFSLAGTDPQSFPLEDMAGRVDVQRN